MQLIKIPNWLSFSDNFVTHRPTDAKKPNIYNTLLPTLRCEENYTTAIDDSIIISDALTNNKIGNYYQPLLLLLILVISERYTCN